MDISQFSNSANQFNTLSGLIAVTPLKQVGYQPKNAPGNISTPSDPLLFHYEGENTVSLESDVTDHYIEDNTAINDHIALRPELITVSGYIGEVSDFIGNNAALNALKQVADKLSLVSSFQPVLSTSAQLAYNAAFFAYQSINNAVNNVATGYKSLSNVSDPSSGQTIVSSDGLSKGKYLNKQQEMFYDFYNYYRNRTLFQIQTPWAIFDNCSIKSLRAIQDQDTSTVTNFEVTFKVMRFAKELQSQKVQGRLQSQNTTLNDLGEISLSKSANLFSSQVA